MKFNLFSIRLTVLCLAGNVFESVPQTFPSLPQPLLACLHLYWKYPDLFIETSRAKLSITTWIYGPSPFVARTRAALGPAPEIHVGKKVP